MLNVGIVGSGFGLYGLLPAFSSLKNCRVVAICGKKTERLTKYCQKIGLEKIYSDWGLMLKNEKLDAVALAVIPTVQYKIAKVAIKKGINIFAEKPLAPNYSQAKELLDLAKKKGVVHAIDFLYPEIEQWKKVKHLIEEKKLGKLKQIYVNWDFLSFNIKNKKFDWKNKVAEGGGALSYYFSHALYYIEYYAGQILDFKSFIHYSKSGKKRIEVGTDIYLTFKNGVTGYAHLNCNAIGLDRHHLIFQCEKGAIILRNEGRSVTNFNLKIITEKDLRKISIPRERIKKDEDERVRYVARLAKRFIDCIVNKKVMIPSFNDGARVQWLIDQIRLNS